MARKLSEELSKKHYSDQVWKDALQRGVCPIRGCDITKIVCVHLNNYCLGSSEAYENPAWSVGGAIDLLAGYAGSNAAENEPESLLVFLWSLYKKLKTYPLSLTQKKILVRSLGLNQTQRQIMRELKIKSSSWYTQTRYKAIEVVRRYSGK